MIEAILYTLVGLLGSMALGLGYLLWFERKQEEKLRRTVTGVMYMAMNRIPEDIMPREDHIERLLIFIEVELRKALND